MRKMREDSTWNQISPEQRETLESWLFEENLGYAKTMERVQQEFGIQTTLASVGRYYRRRAEERQVEELVQAQEMADEVNDLPVSVVSLREAAMKLVGKAILKLASEKPEKLEELVPFTRLLLESEENEIRRSRLKLAEQYFDYEATAAWIKELPHMGAYVDIIGDDACLTHDEKIRRMRAVLYGWRHSGSSGSESGNGI
jgi:hypothetical protein